MTEQPEQPAQTPDPALKGAGLSATGKTADQFSPGDDAPGTTYGDPGGTGTVHEEITGGGPNDDLGSGSGGNSEGEPDEAKNLG